MLRTRSFGAAETNGEPSAATRPDGPAQTMRLTGLHIATRELDHWLWITLWWSSTPDEDFGADRPALVRELGPAWANYKVYRWSASSTGELARILADATKAP